MKTVKQIISECKQITATQSQGVVKLGEAAFDGLTFKDMPQIILFTRQSIRTYPNNQLVGLYYAKSIDQYISIPFNSKTGQFFGEEIVLQQEGMLSNAASKVGGAISNAASSVKKTTTGAASSAVGAVKSAAGAVGNTASKVVSGVTAAKNATTDKVVDVVKDPKKTLQSIRDTAADAINHPVDTYNKVVKSADDALKSVLPDSVNKAIDKAINEPKEKIHNAAANTVGGVFAGSDSSLEDRKATFDRFSTLAATAALAKAGESALLGWREAQEKRARNEKKPIEAGKQKAAVEEPKSAPPATQQKSSASKVSGKPAPKPAAPPSVKAVPKPAPKPAGEPSVKATPKPATKPAAKPEAKKEPKKEPSYFAKKKQELMGSSSHAILSKYFKEDANLGIIKAMIEHDIENSALLFEGEKEVSINNRMARKLWELYSSLNNSNRKEMLRMLNEDASSYRKLINFAVRR
jgi:hypothetical protein